MRTLAAAFLILVASPAVHALGAAEDPDEVLTKTLTLAPLRLLEIRGQIDFELAVGAPGSQVTLTVETTRALFDQLNVSNWWGSGTIAVESGLMGPRERGAVKVKITAPSLEQLTVADHCTGTGTWPGDHGILLVTDFSAVTLAVNGASYQAAVKWRSALALTGKAEHLGAEVKFASSLDTSDLEAQADVTTEKGSNYKPAPTP